MENKTFSIITPVYNGAKKIEKTIKSVVTQDANLYEYIIVDGKSTDQTDSIVSKYLRQFNDNIKYLSEPDNGIYDAMNKGIEMAAGNYLYFLGAGDTLRSDVLRLIKSKLNNTCEMIYGPVYFQKTQNACVDTYDKWKICLINICHQAVFYNKKIFNIIGNYDIDFPIASDYEFNIRCFGEDSIKKRKIDIVIADYEGGGVSDNNIDNKFIQNKKSIINKYLGQKWSDIYSLMSDSFEGSSIPWWVNSKIINFIIDNQITIGIYGAGSFGKELFRFIKYNRKRLNIKVKVKFFFDSNQLKWGENIEGIEVIKPSKANLKQVDKVVIASMYTDEIISQLLEKGLEQDKLFKII